MEEVLDPSLPIVDAHHHIWDRPGSRYLIDEYENDARSGHNIQKSLFVECRLAYREDGPVAFRPVGETEFVAASARDGLIAGIVARADLRVPEIEDVLAAHAEAARGRLRGIRHSIAWDAVVPATTVMPPDLLDDPAFHAGFAALGRAGLSFDAWVFHPQIPALTAVARRHPDVQIILEHIGCPLGIGPYGGRRNEVLQEWRSSLTELAKCPNVAIKLGGIGQPRLGLEWPDPMRTTSEELVRAWGEELRWCAEKFGVARSMFEANFPMDKQSFQYHVAWNAFKQIMIDASQAERSALFHDTATRIYRL